MFQFVFNVIFLLHSVKILLCNDLTHVLELRDDVRVQFFNLKFLAQVFLIHVAAFTTENTHKFVAIRAVATPVNWFFHALINLLNERRIQLLGIGLDELAITTRRFLVSNQAGSWPGHTHLISDRARVYGGVYLTQRRTI